MRVMVIGASGAFGTRLVPRLRQAGHEVTGTSRSPERAHRLRSLADLSAYKHVDRSFAQTSRLRTDGTDHALDAARRAGVQRIVAQSYAPVRYARQGGPVKREDDPLDASPPASIRQAMAAVTYLEQAVTVAGGVALRYGTFYGDPGDKLVEAVCARKVPLVGDGGGIWSFIHLDDAAAATVLALEHDGPAIYNIVDDEPAPTRVWLPELARILGARPPLRLPRPLVRLVAGEAVVMMATEGRGASNSKAKHELGWTLRFPSWRQGFAAAYATSEPLRAAA
jgi:nucleoside-diphosphate-sugar epimerase